MRIAGTEGVSTVGSRRAWQALVAPYEHSVLTQGVIRGIDSLDQRGVEAGKVLAEQNAAELADAETAPSSHDSSTNALIQRHRQLREERP